MMPTQRQIEPAPLNRSDTIKVKSPTRRAAKSRRGCQRCKSRHIKCDETRPHCRRCSEKKISCPGYNQQLKWLSQYEIQWPQSSTTADEGDAAPGPVIESLPSSRLQHKEARPGDLELATSPYASGPRIQETTPPTSVDGQELIEMSSSISWDNIVGFDLDGMVLSSIIDGFWSDQERGIELMQTTSSEANIVETVSDVADDRLQHPLEPSATVDVVGLVSDKESPSDISEAAAQRVANIAYSTQFQPVEITRNTNNYDAGRLLTWFYRIPPRQYSDTDLIEYYFGTVCRLYALFDSAQNPFRALVGINWSNSTSIRLVIESMACGHLANKEPFMVHLGKQKRVQARASIARDVRLWRSHRGTANMVLLAILLLGLSVSWHDPADIGTDLIETAREIVHTKLRTPRAPDVRHEDQLQQFFFNAMIYWEMLVAFVSPAASWMPADLQPMPQDTTSPGMDKASMASNELPTVIVHPWTGVSPRIMMLFAESGRLLRWCLAGQRVVATFEVKWASDLEQALKNTQFPGCGSIVDHGDENTPKEHLIMLGEAYRWAGLINTYHAVPQLLSDRLTAMDGPLEDALAKAEACRWYRGNLALRVLEILEKLPLSSGTLCLQPILLLTAGSELQFHEPAPSVNLIAQPLDSCVRSARKFSKNRLCELARLLPQKPYLRMLEIMKETWVYMDSVGADIHWTQIMSSRALQTIMG